MAEEDSAIQQPIFNEAPFSANTFARDTRGFKIQFTIRAESWETGLAQVEDMIGFLVDQGYEPDSRSTQTTGTGSDVSRQAQDEDAPDWCGIHKEKMQRHSNNRGTWYSHKVGSDWCRGVKKNN